MKIEAKSTGRSRIADLESSNDAPNVGSRNSAMKDGKHCLVDPYLFTEPFDSIIRSSTVRMRSISRG